jgi:ribosomal protein S18 acetylase RimI-like enzyme
MFVQRNYRGRKISSMMRDETFSRFRRRKMKYVCLTVMSGNKHARSIYERWGFADFSNVM